MGQSLAGISAEEPGSDNPERRSLRRGSRRLVGKLRPTSGLAHVAHILLKVILPLLVFVLVRIHFYQLALALILLSKWRMLAVKPRHWLANIRANAVDLTVGLSSLIFMVHSSTQAGQLGWAAVYGVWLILIKPRSSGLMVSVQAMMAQVMGLFALFLHFGDSPAWVLVIFAWGVCYGAARHFFASFDEPLSRHLSDLWGYFAVALVWLLSHWLLFYGAIAQPTLLLSVLGFGLGGLYYLDKTDRLSVLLRRQFVFVMIAIIVIVLVFSHWGDKAI